MNSAEGSGSEPADEPKGPQRRVDRRLLDEIFGEVLPETTSDEREAGTDSGHSEQWYRENTPPHHD